MTIFTSKTETKRLAIDLRKKGYSYSEIADFVSVSKSTLGYWLKNLKLTPPQEERIRQKRIVASRRGGAKKSQHTVDAIEKIRSSSAKNIYNISKRELWLMGVTLYWRERLRHQQDFDLRKGVRFASSDPHLIRFFLHWLIRIGKLKNDELLYDVFLTEDNRSEIKNSKNYWARVTSSPKEMFTRFYIQKKYVKKNERIVKKQKVIGLKRNQNTLGILRIRVRASSMLARQISGWIQGIRNTLA